VRLQASNPSLSSEWERKRQQLVELVHGLTPAPGAAQDLFLFEASAVSVGLCGLF
jgi:hypothetical protein